MVFSLGVDSFDCELVTVRALATGILYRLVLQQLLKNTDPYIPHTIEPLSVGCMELFIAIYLLGLTL